MDHLHYTANEHRKGQHLTFECRVLIQTRLKDGWSPNRIAKEIGCAPNTVRNEIKRGTVSLYKGNILRYKATAGQDAYERNRQSCCRHYDFFEKSNFISFVEQKFFEEGWSLDACVGRALKNELFTRDQIVCTKTLYGYIDLGLLGIKNIDLPEKLRRSPKKTQVHKNKRILGRSIEEHWDDVFKTITTDNGSEFSTLSDLETLSKTLVYFAHPYTSCEKGSVERHNGLIRRFIPKGKRIDSYSNEQIAQVELWCNGLPRKLLGYRTPDELFEAELDRIYSCAT